jgi:hypothetical protein
MKKQGLYYELYTNQFKEEAAREVLKEKEKGKRADGV